MVMSDQETRLEDMCSHCRKKPAKRRHSGVQFKYCSLECSAIEQYRNHAALSLIFSIMFIAAVYDVVTEIIAGNPFPLDIFWWIQVLMPIIAFPIFTYSAIIGYRGARREQGLKKE